MISSTNRDHLWQRCHTITPSRSGLAVASGGVTESVPLWREIVCGITNMPVLLPDAIEIVSRGVALLALEALGMPVEATWPCWVRPSQRSSL